MSSPSLRVLLVAIQDGADELAEAVHASGLAKALERVASAEEALETILDGGIGVCFAPSTAGPDTSASLTLSLAQAGDYVPVVAVVDEPTAGFEAIADEGAADFVWRGDLSAESVSRALLVAQARAEAVTRFQNIQADRDAVLAATGAVVVALDREGRLVDFRSSPSFQSDFGEAAPGARFATLFSEGARVGAVEALRSAYKGRAGRFMQMRARAGRPLMLYWTVARSGKGYRAVGVDRSEASREAYRADLYRVVLETILEQAPITAFVVDAEGAFLLTMGHEVDELATQGISAFEAYRDEPGVVENVLRTLDGTVVSDHLAMRDGRQFEMRCTPFSLGVNEAFGALCVSTELTERALSSNERSRLDAILDLTGDMVVVVDSAGELIYLSPALRAAVGWTASALRAEGGVVRLLSDPSQRSTIARSVRGGDPWHGTAGLRTATGEDCLYEVDARPLFDPEGARIGGFARFVPV